jgi:hypothetical protein
MASKPRQWLCANMTVHRLLAGGSESPSNTAMRQGRDPSEG